MCVMLEGEDIAFNWTQTLNYSELIYYNVIVIIIKYAAH